MHQISMQGGASALTNDMAAGDQHAGRRPGLVLAGTALVAAAVWSQAQHRRRRPHHGGGPRRQALHERRLVLLKDSGLCSAVRTSGQMMNLPLTVNPCHNSSCATLQATPEETPHRAGTCAAFHLQSVMVTCAPVLLPLLPLMHVGACATDQHLTMVFLARRQHAGLRDLVAVGEAAQSAAKAEVVRSSGAPHTREMSQVAGFYMQRCRHNMDKASASCLRSSPSRQAHPCCCGAVRPTSMCVLVALTSRSGGCCSSYSTR